MRVTCSTKLTDTQVGEIKKLLAELSMAEIGRRYGVTRETIRRIKVGILYASVPAAL